MVTWPLSALSVGLVVSSSSGCHVHILPEGSSVLVSPSTLSDPCSVDTQDISGYKQLHVR